MCVCVCVIVITVPESFSALFISGLSNPYTSSFLGFSLYVSNTTDISQGILCFKDNNFTKRTIPAVFTTNCSIPGQYVIYYNERLLNGSYPIDYSAHTQINLCEVEVYGECLLYSLMYLYIYLFFYSFLSHLSRISKL